MSTTFTAKNFEKLKSTCEKIIAISNENIEGQLMAIQMVCLGENISEFIENPIIKKSGIIPVDYDKVLYFCFAPTNHFCSYERIGCSNHQCEHNFLNKM